MASKTRLCYAGAHAPEAMGDQPIDEPLRGIETYPQSQVLHIHFTLARGESLGCEKRNDEGQIAHATKVEHTLSKYLCAP